MKKKWNVEEETGEAGKEKEGRKAAEDSEGEEEAVTGR